LQGLTNPEQLDKFITISGILDRQNSEEINLTNNLSLRLSPIRDFDPKDWGCRNCPCNIHSNPYVSCDCCSCNVCPFKSNNSNQDQEKKKQKKFPKNSFYSYSYTYDPDNMGPNTNTSLLSTTYGFNDSTYMNSPKKRNVIFDKELNKYKKTMVNSSDDENEYEDYMRKVNTIKNSLGQNNQPYINNNNILPNQLNNNLYNNKEESYHDNRIDNKNYNEEINENTKRRTNDNNYNNDNINIKARSNYDNEEENQDGDNVNPHFSQNKINPQLQKSFYGPNNQNPNNILKKI
jgi:hypothetical protein